MKRLILVSLLVLVAVIGNSVPVCAVPPPDVSLKSHDFSASHFAIKLPVSWKTRNDVILPVVAAPREVINSANELPSLKVRVRPAEAGLTLKVLGDSERKQWGISWNVKSDTTSGVPPRQTRVMIADTNVNGEKRKIMTLFAISNGRCFIVTCADTRENFPKQEKLFSKILASFVAM
ncbi:MAG: hypothetical protein U0105_26965 [Candidatus Obscuribacterales bacterium]